MGDKTKLGQIWDIIWDKASVTISKPTDIFIAKENSVKEIILDTLSRKGTYVSMAPRSNKYFIINDSIGIKIMVNGTEECVRANISGNNHTWNFRQSYISGLIDTIIDWIEEDRDGLETDYFRNDMVIISSLKEAILKAEPKHKVAEANGCVTME